MVGGRDKLRTLRDKMKSEKRRVIEYLERKNMDEFWRNVELEKDKDMAATGKEFFHQTYCCQDGWNGGTWWSWAFQISKMFILNQHYAGIKKI